MYVYVSLILKFDIWNGCMRVVVSGFGFGGVIYLFS